MSRNQRRKELHREVESGDLAMGRTLVFFGRAGSLAGQSDNQITQVERELWVKKGT